MEPEKTLTPAPISLEQYRSRRERVLEALQGAAAVVFAGHDPHDDSQLTRWKTDRLFWYLTGLDHESGAAVLFDPTAEDSERRITLFLRPRDPEAERWNGPREPLDSSLKAKTGFDSLARTTSLPARLTEAARRSKRLACLHPFAPYNESVSPDLEVYRKVAERVPGVAIEDHTQLIPSMRAVKSQEEIRLIQHAVEITHAGLEAVMASLRPGVSEADISDLLLEAFRRRGGELAFLSIVASGPNATVLHHRDLRRTVEEGDLVVIDCGAAYQGYAADVTRTLPASGVFTTKQRAVYDVVLAANLAAIEAVRPGVTLSEVQQAALSIIAEAGYRDYFIHGIGHHLGIEVHDVTPDGPLAPGMVLTIEPGIYLPEAQIGIRIEDDLLVTQEGALVLTSEIPKSAQAIEAALASRQTPRQ